MTDEDMMRRALDFARRAEAIDEVPVGAVLAIGDRVIAAAHNEREVAHDPTAHAEMIALRIASRVLGRWRLDDATIFVTLEPCAMCAGALVNARIARLVYGAEDPKAGAVRSLFQLADDPRLNHRIAITSGVLGEACGGILRGYFRRKRAASAFSVRRAVVEDAPGIARVHVESWRSTYRGIVSDAVLDAVDVEERTRVWAVRIAAGESAIFVASRASSSEIVAFVACGPNREGLEQYLGAVGAFYVLADVQGRGAGRLLFARALSELAAMKLRPVIVWVLEANVRARSFYETVGGAVAGRRAIEIGGTTYTEVAYTFAEGADAFEKK